MNYPTPEEIRFAHDAINADGPAAETTIRLGAMVLHDPVLRAILNRLVQAVERGSGVGMPIAGALAGAITTGLNYGLRIHEQRMAAGRKEAADAAG